jgi:hypothetical protein
MAPGLGDDPCHFGDECLQPADEVRYDEKLAVAMDIPSP